MLSFSLSTHSYLQVEREQQIQLRITQAVDEAKHQASEEKQRLLVDASRQMREAIKECNTQSSSKEVILFLIHFLSMHVSLIFVLVLIFSQFF